MDAKTVVLGLATQCLGCRAVGVSEPGYDFYMCEACLDKLLVVLELSEAGALATAPQSGLVS